MSARRPRGQWLPVAAALLVSGCNPDASFGPEPPPSALRFSALDAGYYHTCGLTPLGRAWCWGGNAFGTIGDGTSADRLRPVNVSGNLRFIALSAGAGHNCALTTSGTAWCWGHNDEGQLGDGSFTGRNTPAPVADSHRFVAISAGHAHSCALTAAGVAWCWGDNSRGQLGDGSNGNRSSRPVQVSFPGTFATVSAGYYQTCGLTPDGDAWCWGLNDSGQLGTGSRADQPTPVRVTGEDFTHLAPGDRFVCGSTYDGVWCWGSNNHQQLGGSSPDTALLPVRLQDLSPARAVTASSGASTIAGTESFACAADADGRVLCWGGAIRALRERGGPGEVDARLRAAAVAAGADHVCILTSQGHAWCGGANHSGQLGDGSRTDRSTLVAVIGPG